MELAVRLLACLELADWYTALATTAAPGARAAMYARAKAYLERFLEIHAAKDLNRPCATLGLEKIGKALDQLRSAPQPASTAARPTKVSAAGPAEPAAARPKKPPVAATGVIRAGRSVDLLGLVDPVKDAVAGTWELTDGTLACARSARFARLVIPVVPQGSYELEFRFIRTASNRPVVFFLPVGSNACKLMLDHVDGAVDGLGVIGGKPSCANETTRRNGPLTNDREYAVRVRVLVPNGRDAQIAVFLDGKPHIAWRGA